MAYLPSMIDNEEDDPTQTREAGVISGSSQAARPSAAPSKTGYTNVNDYIEANKGGASQLAGQVAGGVEKQASSAQQALKDIEKEYSSSSDPGEYAGISSNIASGGVGGLSEADKATAKRYATGNFSGSENLSKTGGYSRAIDERKKALDLIKLSNDERGTGSLIRETIKPQNYSRGEQGFDTALLRSTPEAAQRLKAVGEQYKGLGDDLGGAETRAVTAAEAARQKFTEGKTKLTGDIQARMQALEGNFGGRGRAVAGSQELQEYNSLLDILGQGPDAGITMQPAAAQLPLTTQQPRRIPSSFQSPAIPDTLQPGALQVGNLQGGSYSPGQVKSVGEYDPSGGLGYTGRIPQGVQPQVQMADSNDAIKKMLQQYTNPITAPFDGDGYEDGLFDYLYA